MNLDLGRRRLDGGAGSGLLRNHFLRGVFMGERLFILANCADGDRAERSGGIIGEAVEAVLATGCLVVAAILMLVLPGFVVGIVFRIFK